MYILQRLRDKWFKFAHVSGGHVICFRTRRITVSEYKYKICSI